MVCMVMTNNHNTTIEFISLKTLKFKLQLFEHNVWLPLKCRIMDEKKLQVKEPQTSSHAHLYFYVIPHYQNTN
jgi:hypothetical protein